MAKTAWVNARLTKEEHEAFAELARKEGTTMSKLLRQMVNAAVVWTEQTEWDDCA